MKYIFLLTFLLQSTFSIAQFRELLNQKKDSLQLLSLKILKAESAAERVEANNGFLAEMKELIKYDSSFSYSFNELESISILASQDGQLRVFSWNVPLEKGKLDYYSIIQYFPNDGSYRYFFLNGSDTSLQEIKEFKAGAENWPGALYLDLIEKKAVYKTYYTLLGWNGSNRLTSIKLIDVISFDKNGELTFGEPIFRMGNKIQNRMIFEYAATNKMTLTYREDLDIIIFDHLSPPDRNLMGLYEYYGPDLSFDALEWNGRQWVLIEDVDPDKGLKKKESFFQSEIKKKAKSDQFIKRNGNQ